jgi:hypothetical protein
MMAFAGPLARQKTRLDPDFVFFLCSSAGEDAMEKTTQSQVLGRYIVADPDICHGKPTFRGTRILVADVLDKLLLA